ncbi:hypothetical protein ABT074_44335, partial [Streptomyces sp. NPDC002205]
PARRVVAVDGKVVRGSRTATAAAIQLLAAMDLWGSKSRRCRSRGVSILVDDASDNPGAERASVVEVVHDCGLLGRAGR